MPFTIRSPLCLAQVNTAAWRISNCILYSTRILHWPTSSHDRMHVPSNEFGRFQTALDDRARREFGGWRSVPKNVIRGSAWKKCHLGQWWEKCHSGEVIGKISYGIFIWNKRLENASTNTVFLIWVKTCKSYNFILFVRDGIHSVADYNSTLMGRGGAQMVRYVFLILFCIFIILIVSFYLPGIYFLNTVHQTFHFQVLYYDIS